MATAHDRLGCRSFLEGRITKVLVQAIHDHLQNSTSRYTATYWAQEFSSCLILLTHHRWRHQNAHLHNKGKEHKTVEEHSDVMNHTRELTRLDSSISFNSSETYSILKISMHFLKVPLWLANTGFVKLRLPLLLRPFINRHRRNANATTTQLSPSIASQTHENGSISQLSHSTLLQSPC